MNNTPNDLTPYIKDIPTPIYICEEQLLENNLKTLADVAQQADVKILLALKAYAYYPSFDLIAQYLSGVCCSGLYEAKLGDEYLKPYGDDMEIHTYSPAFKAEDIAPIAKASNHLVFNSIGGLYAHYKRALSANPHISLGLRINPQCSFSPVELYDPCAAHSRFGVKIEELDDTVQELDDKVMDIIEGLHFHTLCEQNSLALEKTLLSVEEQFGKYFGQLQWLNMGGGHLITKADYDVAHLIELLQNFRAKYPHLKIYLEPGEAIAWQCGTLVATVLDIIKSSDRDIAILDTSAEAHMPDVIAMPYRPEVRFGDAPFKKAFTYRLGGNTCLSGDIIGDYSFDEPLSIGDKLIFEDMIHYTMVKNTLFNGIPLPSIGYLKKDGELITKHFGFETYRDRLG